MQQSYYPLIYKYFVAGVLDYRPCDKYRPAPPPDGLDYLIHLAAMSKAVARQRELSIVPLDLRVTDPIEVFLFLLGGVFLLLT